MLLFSSELRRKILVHLIIILNFLRNTRLLFKVSILFWIPIMCKCFSLHTANRRLSLLLFAAHDNSLRDSFPVPRWRLMRSTLSLADCQFVHLLWETNDSDLLPIFLSFKNILLILWELPHTAFNLLDIYFMWEWCSDWTYVWAPHAYLCPWS